MSENKYQLMSLDTDLAQQNVVGACSDGIVRLYRIAEDSLQIIDELTGHYGPATKAVFCRYGDMIISSDFNGYLVVWYKNGQTFKKSYEKQIVRGPIYDISLRNNSESMTIFCGCEAGELICVEMNTNLISTESSKKIHEFGIQEICSNSEYIAASCVDGALIVLDKNLEKVDIGPETMGASHIAISQIKYDMCFMATSLSNGKLIIFEQRNGGFKIKNEFDLESACGGLHWSMGGFSLTANLGESVRVFEITENGDFTEVKTE